MTCLSLAGLILFFQNCGPGFKVSDLQAASTVVDRNQNGPDSKGPETAAASHTDFHLGSSSGLSSFSLDSIRGVAQYKSTTIFAGTSVGWLNWDAGSSQLAAVDAGGGTFQTYALDLQNGSLSAGAGTGFKSALIHTTIVSGLGRKFVYTSSYQRGELDLMSFSESLGDPQVISPSVSFGAGAKTHSSAFDSKRNLLFVANLGLNRVSIFKVNRQNGTLEAAGFHSVMSPRTLVYQADYDKLYLVTEADTGASQLIAFSIQEGPSGINLASEGSLRMPLAGADLKINPIQGYAMATAREPGKESVWGMPLTDDGKKDSSRPEFSFSLDRPQPRSLELTADGLYLLVAMNSTRPDNVQIFKLNYSPQKQLISAERIFQYSLPEGVLCSLSVAR